MNNQLSYNPFVIKLLPAFPNYYVLFEWDKYIELNLMQ